MKNNNKTKSHIAFFESNSLEELSKLVDDEGFDDSYGEETGTTEIINVSYSTCYNSEEGKINYSCAVAYKVTTTY